MSLEAEAATTTTSNGDAKTPSSPPLPTPTIRILTLNCWGLKFLAPDHGHRLSEIGRRIATSSPPPDIVGLQEVWTHADYTSIREQTRQILPHGKFYYSGIFGGGLVILSRWPIEESSMFRYPLNGRPTAFFRGDWFVGKGVACARIRMPATHASPGSSGAGGNVQGGTGGGGRLLEVFNTHLHAPYEREPNDSYICHRTAQAWEIAKLMRHASERGSLVIALGDFNMVPMSFAHVLIEGRSGGAKDVWRILRPDSSIGASVDDPESERRRKHGLPEAPSVQESMEEHGHTCDSTLNTWRWTKAQRRELKTSTDRRVYQSETDSKAKRLDYIFFGGLERGWRVNKVGVCMTERHPTLHCSLSDHFGVESELVRDDDAVCIDDNISDTHDNDNTEAAPPHHHHHNHHHKTVIAKRLSVNHQHDHTGRHIDNDTTVEMEEKQDCLDLDDDPPQPPKSPSSSTPLSPSPPIPILPTTIHTHLTPAFYNSILTMIHTYKLRERRQRRLRLIHFLVSCGVSIACFVAVWWSPHNFVSFLLVLLSSLGLMAGTVDGLIGGLFVGSELRALCEFEWEVRCAVRLGGGEEEEEEDGEECGVRDWWD